MWMWKTNQGKEGGTQANWIMIILPLLCEYKDSDVREKMLFYAAIDRQ